MQDIFVRLLFGHLFGDYMFQTKKMALQKGEKNLKGIFWCTVHCLVYTLSISVFLGRFDFMFMTLVFLSHYPIDRWSLASKWLNFIHGRDILVAYERKEKYREIDIAFSCLVYAVVDNTMHLFLLWLIVKGGV